MTPPALLTFRALPDHHRLEVNRFFGSFVRVVNFKIDLLPLGVGL